MDNFILMDDLPSHEEKIAYSKIDAGQWTPKRETCLENQKKKKKKKNITKWTEPRNIIAPRVSWNQHQPRDHDSYPRINTWLTWNPHQELEENSQPKFH